MAGYDVVATPNRYFVMPGMETFLMGFVLRHPSQNETALVMVQGFPSLGTFLYDHLAFENLPHALARKLGQSHDL